MNPKKCLILFYKLKHLLATRPCFDRIARNNQLAHRVIEFVPEEKRPVKCYLPVKWMPKLRDGWVRLTFTQFMSAYKLELGVEDEL